LKYWFMINGHFISIELNSNSFNVNCDFDTKVRSSKGDVLMNLNGWYKGKENKR
jgi:hypothetical protein